MYLSATCTCEGGGEGSGCLYVLPWILINTNHGDLDLFQTVQHPSSSWRRTEWETRHFALHSAQVSSTSLSSDFFQIFDTKRSLASSKFLM